MNTALTNIHFTWFAATRDDFCIIFVADLCHFPIDDFV